MHEKIDTSYLKPGDHDIIAAKLGVTRSAVANIACGHAKSKRIARALVALNEARRQQEEQELQELCDSIKTEAVTDIKSN